MLGFIAGEVVELQSGQALPPGGVYWVDIERSTAWRAQLPQGIDLKLHSRHEADVLSAKHPPFFDKAREYDLLVMRAPVSEAEVHHPLSRPVVFLLTGNAVITVRESDEQAFVSLRERWLAGELTLPSTPESLLHRLADQIADSFLANRDPINERLAVWQDRLLDPQDPFDDWRSLMRLRNELRWQGGIIDTQISVLDDWREESSAVFSENLSIRFRDLRDHLRRVSSHAAQTQAAIDALVQIHFASNGQRTNQVMQFLAVLSAIFLPLNLLVGYFGMNFSSMPFLGVSWAAGALAGIMLTLVVLLLWFFRRWRWI